MPMWLILVIAGLWLSLPVVIGAFAVWQAFREDREERRMAGGDVIEFPTGYAGSVPRPHVEVGVREALDAAARSPRSEPLGAEPRLPRDRPGPGLRA